MSRILPHHRNISGWAIHNPVATTVIFLLLTVAGIFAYPMLRINNTPDLDLPAVVISVVQSGAAPTEMETQVTRRVEDAVAGLGQVKTIRSIIVDGSSTTVVEFTLGTNIDRAANDVRDAVGRIRSDLPAGVREPVVTRVEATGGAIVTFTVSSPRLTVPELSWLVDDTISRAMLAVNGVAQVNRVGGVAREVRVALRPDRLLALGITAGQVNAQLREQNINLPGGRGTIGTGEQAIRTLGSALTVAELRERSIILPSGRSARLAELADVEDGTAEIRTAARLDGRPVVGFEIVRTRGSSEVRVAEEVMARARALSAEMDGVEITPVTTTATFVLAGYHAAVEALVIGSVLAMLVVYLFLRDWRATIMASLAMPLSLIPTFFVMQWLGFSLNNVTLLGLTLVVGVLVDDAIVEIENTVRHIRQTPGISVFRASLDASAEIGLAVVATTATILAVFVPVAFMPGIPGQFFRQFGLTVAAAVVFSLVVARLLTPLLGAYFLKPPRHEPEREGRVGRWYGGVLRWCLRHKRLTILGGVAFFALSLALIPFISRDFVPGADRGRISMALELAPGASIEDTDAAVREATRILRARPEVVTVFASLGTQVGGGGGPGLGSVTRNGDPRVANILATLVPFQERALRQVDIENALRPELEMIPGARIRFGADGQSGSRLQVTLVGQDPVALAAAGDALAAQMRTIPGLSGARSTAALARPELQITPREARAADLGVSVSAIANTIRLATVGDVDQALPRFTLAERQIPIRVMLDERARADMAELRALRVEGRGGLAVPLEAVADIAHAAGPAQIDRLGRQRQLTVEAELGGMPLGDAMQRVNALPIMQNLPPGVANRPTGDSEVMAELFGGFLMALGTGVLLVYLVLVLLFGGFLQPLTIMSALPLSLGGALLALLVAQQAMGVSAVIGVLMLMGIVAKNSILLVEYAIMIRADGQVDRETAIIEACRKRARPIVMTTIAMVAGMAHIALGIGAESEFRAPMALVVIGGLATSTLLSLLFVPVAYVYMDRFEGWVARRLRPKSWAQAPAE
ncbi:efflux RND transporter permease subunit [Roseococcus suduntuyensis]|uniref:HAE1 family hydrophobic/amphiphilic exporter-1 n=1 Tax=Roseococcus suduntuyensis TaxID=455361 RepID=A0A840ABX9_9PROT|nr:efflux RND transporter permease subunit [Roseococcus suduntuyensis]MBB3897764.1 HAE1 family hydrophobic/amphiphilic exporter-1 [Roseococcus suduntuyensis]